MLARTLPLFICKMRISGFGGISILEKLCAVTLWGVSKKGSPGQTTMLMRSVMKDCADPRSACLEIPHHDLKNT